MKEFEAGFISCFFIVQAPNADGVPRTGQNSAGTGSAPETDSAPDLGRRFVVLSLVCGFSD
jgi:hypothetical protein